MPFKNPHPLYSVWRGMKDRCYNTARKMYPRYGGRGITVCDRWLHSFQHFADDMGARPPNYTLERNDNNLGYTPENCRWAPRWEQQLNLERTHRFVVDGVMVIPALVSRETGQKAENITKRILRGEPLERVISPNKLVRYGLNTGAGKVSGEKQRAKTHCKNGHEYNEANTLVTKEGWRRCRQCHADRQRERNKRLRDE